jgi:hypothetical protein
MPSYGALVWGALASGVLTLIALRFALHERSTAVLAVAAAAAMAGPFVWNLILRHTGGDFFVDAPGYVFPISLQDTGSGVFALAFATPLLGLGPLRAVPARRSATVALICGLAALLVDIYLY